MWLTNVCSHHFTCFTAAGPLHCCSESHLIASSLLPPAQTTSYLRQQPPTAPSPQNAADHCHITHIQVRTLKHFHCSFLSFSNTYWLFLLFYRYTATDNKSKFVTVNVDVMMAATYTVTGPYSFFTSFSFLIFICFLDDDHNWQGTTTTAGDPNDENDDDDDHYH
jgi:hypothetical protein